MKEVDMRARRGNINCPRHAETSFEQRPVKRFSIESDQYAALGYALGQRDQHGMLLALLAHKKLFDFEAARVPPRDANEERIGASASGQSRGFRIEEKPLRGVAHFLRRARSQKAQRGRIDFLLRRVQSEAVSDSFREPPAQPEVFAKPISPRRGAENFGEANSSGGNVGRCSARRVTVTGRERGAPLARVRLERLEPS